MSLVVGSARIDENGHISGGKPGDQTGNEVSTQAYYVHSKGWYCLRPKSITVANAIAEAMLQWAKKTHRRRTGPRLQPQMALQTTHIPQRRTPRWLIFSKKES